MQYEVFLRLMEDDATGVWGLVPHNAFYTGFNSFWSTDGIFHDVFEHYFEDAVLPYFKGKHAFQLYGEMCASGHGIAYFDIGINNFKYRKDYTYRDFTGDTQNELESIVYEAMYNNNDAGSGHSKFPLEHYQVPRQQINDVCNLMDWVNDYLGWYDAHKHLKCLKPLKASQIKNCYIYGYKRAEKIIGKDKEHAYNVLNQFLEDWHEITKISVQKIAIDDANAYPIIGFKFVVTNNGKLNVKTTIIDEVRNEYPIDLLLK